MPDLDIALLRSFVAVSRAGSIRAAAERIGRTQSAVSLQIKRLEATFGEALFHRSGSGVVLTASGERFMSGAERILAAHDETMTGIGSRGLQGTIAFGCPEDYLTAFLPGLLRRYGRDHPGIEIEIVCAPTVELHPLLQRRRIDLALVSLADSAPPAEIIRREPLVWVGNGEDRTSPLTLALSGPGTLDHRAARRALDQAGIPYRIAHASNGLAGLLAIVRSGLALSVMTRGAVPPDLLVLDRGLPPLPRIGMAIAYAAAKPAPAVRSFGGFIATQLRSG